MISGAPVGLLSVILGMILSGAFTFFSPMRISAVDAASSNGAQLAVLGAATHTIVTTSPTISFYMLFCMLAADTMMSCSTFFQEHQGQMAAAASSQVGLLEKEGYEAQHLGG